MLATSQFVRPQCALIEAKMRVDSGGNTISPAYFSVDTNNFMLNKKLVALEYFCSIEVAYSPLSPGVPVADFILTRDATVTLLREDGLAGEAGEFQKTVPLFMMRRVMNAQQSINTACELYRMEPACYSWNDSYVQMPKGSFIPGGYVSFLFLATFLLPVQDEKIYQRLIHEL